MSVLNTKFTELAISKNGGGYVWGSNGDIMTLAIYKKLVRWFGKSRYPYGNKWNGKFSADCSGFVVWLMRQLEVETWRDTTANGIYYTRCKSISRNDLKVGSLCFRSNSKKRITHMAIYIGNGKVIHARSSYYGIRIDKIGNSFNLFGNLKEMEFLPQLAEVKPTYKRMLRKKWRYMRGEDVKLVQARLKKLGFDCGIIDGIYGKNTKKAVLQFQYSAFKDTREHDGIVGRRTWGKLF